MPFSFTPFLDVTTGFFVYSLLAVILIVQIILGVIMPGQSHNPPYVWWLAQSLTRALSDKLNRKQRSVSSLKFRGFLALCFMAVVGWSLSKLAQIAVYSFDYGWLVYVFLVFGCIGVMNSWRIFRSLIAVKTLKDIVKQATPLSDITGVRFNKADPHTIARTAVIYAAYSLMRLVVAPVLFFTLFGLTGLLIYIFISAGFYGLDLGKANTPYWRWFYLLRQVLDYVPARLTALFVYISAFFTPTASPRQLLILAFDGKQKFSGISFSALLKAYAGACRVSLGGAVTYKDGEKRLYPWVGIPEATAKADIVEIKRAFVLHIYSCVLILLVVLFVLAG